MQYTVELKRTQTGLYIDGQLCTIRRGHNVVCIENYSSGFGHTAHPNIDETGSVSGMKNLGHWRKDDRIIKEAGYYYNMSSIVISCGLDALAYFLEIGGDLPNIPTVTKFEKGRFFTFSF